VNGCLVVHAVGTARLINFGVQRAVIFLLGKNHHSAVSFGNHVPLRRTVDLLMRHDGLAGPASTYTLRLAEGVYPNQPNVRRYTVDLKAALFADPRFPVRDIGPFVLAIRKPVGRDWCLSVVRYASRGRRQTCCPTLARSRSAGPYRRALRARSGNRSSGEHGGGSAAVPGAVTACVRHTRPSR
jgi:hypothetical protein